MKLLLPAAALCALLLLTPSATHAQWTSIGLSTERVTAIAVDSVGNIFVGTYNDGLYRSTDGGAHWSLVLGSIMGVYEVFSITIDNLGNIYAGTYGSGLFVSTNGGSSWGGLSSDGVNGLPIDDVYGAGRSSNGNLVALDGSGSVGMA